MKKNNRPCWTVMLLAWFLSTLPVTAFGFSYTISENQINNVLKLTFPYQTRIGSSLVNLTDPVPLFYASTQEIGLAIYISMKEENSPDVSARAYLRGRIQFDSIQQQLQLVRPKIENLSWVNPPEQHQKQLTSTLEQWIGQDLPVIVLLDIKQLTNNAFTPTLRDVKVKNNSIEVVF